MTVTQLTLIAAGCLALAACGADVDLPTPVAGPPTSVGTTTSAGTAQPPTGITSSNGGGQRQLGNAPSVTVGPGGTAISPLPNGRGTSY